MTQGNIHIREIELRLVVDGVAVSAAACLSVSAPVGVRRTF